MAQVQRIVTHAGTGDDHGKVANGVEHTQHSSQVHIDPMGNVQGSDLTREELAVLGEATHVSNGLDLRNVEGSRNRAAGVEIRELSAGGSFIVVDDFLMEEEAAAALEEARASKWQPFLPDHKRQWARRGGPPRDSQGLWKADPPEDIFPGLRATLTARYEGAVSERLHSLPLEKAFADVLRGQPLRRRWSNHSFFGLVCTSPSSLSLAQQAPHVDFGDALHGERGASEVRLALVHYLSRDWQPARMVSSPPNDEKSGGTAFYRERYSRSARFLPDDCEKIQLATSHQSIFCPGSAEKLCARRALRPSHCPSVSIFRPKPTQSYQSEGDTHFDLLAVVPYRYNRAVIYAAKQLHSAFIDRAAELALSCDPAVGRLTSNLFIV